MFSLAFTIYLLVSGVVAFFYGFLLDTDPYAFVYILPFIAVIGVLSIFSLAKIDYTEENAERPRISLLGSVKESTKNMEQQFEAVLNPESRRRSCVYGYDGISSKINVHGEVLEVNQPGSIARKMSDDR
jgi:hypothetical protein